MVSVLLVAPGADGTDVGEAWIGYEWARRLSRRHEVTVLTLRKHGHPPLAEQVPLARVVEWRPARLPAAAERFESLVKPWYPQFHAGARRWIRRARRSGARFDVGFQPLPVAMRYPSPLVDAGLPWVLGPVGGSLPDPPGFAGSDTAPAYVRLRGLDGLRLRHDPWLHRTYTGATTVLGIGGYVADLLEGMPLRRFQAFPDTGVARLPPPAPPRPDGGPLRLLFVGRVVRTKGTREAIRTLTHLRVPAVLDVVGDGFDLRACRALAHELGVAERVTFHGRLAKEDVAARYREADVFLFPSYREPGGTVVHEALSYGLPAVVAARGGPADTVDAGCGIRVIPRSPEQYPLDLAAAVEPLADPAIRARMGAAARTRADDLSWRHRVPALEEILGEAMQREGSRW